MLAVSSVYLTLHWHECLAPQSLEQILPEQHQLLRAIADPEAAKGKGSMQEDMGELRGMCWNTASGCVACQAVVRPSVARRSGFTGSEHCRYCNYGLPKSEQSAVRQPCHIIIDNPALRPSSTEAMHMARGRCPSLPAWIGCKDGVG